MTFEAALAILSSSTLSFTKAMDFNDVFEMDAIHNYTSIVNDIGMMVSLFETDHGTLSLAIDRSYGVLSLTRNPVNNLMWSHYADEHRGVVLGFDVEEAGFCCENKNVVPANLGDIIYTKTVPNRLGNNSTFKRLSYYRSVTSSSQESYDFFKYAYLFKGIDWAYEEEIRVVKKIDRHFFDEDNDERNYYNNSNGNWRVLKLTDDKCLNLCKFPPSALKEIYFGHKVMSTKNIESIMYLIHDEVIVKSSSKRRHSYELEIQNMFEQETKPKKYSKI